MNQLTELNSLPSHLEEPERLKEMACEDDIKRGIKRGKGTRSLARKYGVSDAFVWKCRKELRAEGEL